MRVAINHRHADAEVREEIESMIAGVERDLGPVDTRVHNAGIARALPLESIHWPAKLVMMVVARETLGGRPGLIRWRAYWLSLARSKRKMRA